MITVAAFVSAMEKHWVEELGNVGSRALSMAWRQIGEAFIQQIQDDDDPNRRGRWTILSPPTGSGKTQSAVLFSSMLSQLPPEQHPGVLLIVRRIEDADILAEEINRYSQTAMQSSEDKLAFGFAGKDIAVSWHSENKHKRKLEDLKDYPVLVVCHRAYEIALDVLGSDSTIEGTWPYLHEFTNGTRKLVIVDEAIDLLAEASLDIEGIKTALRFTPYSIEKQFPCEMASLRQLESLFNKLHDLTDEKTTADKLLSDRPFEEREGVREKLRGAERPDFKALRDALRSVRCDLMMKKTDQLENARIQSLIDKALSSANALLKSWFWFTKNGHQGPTLLTARLLVPEGVKGGIIMDATASCNVIFELFDKADVLQPPSGTRDYTGVKLHVSMGHRVGKGYMSENGQELSEKLIANLETQEDLKGKSVFIVTHKDVRPHLAGLEPKTFKFDSEHDLGHWGAVNGSNLWRDHEACVIFGLQYRPDSWAVNTFFAYAGPRGEDFLRPFGDRQYGQHTNITSALMTSQLTADVIQAVNRIRCRRVTTETGGCPSADIYLALPKDAQGDAIVKGLTKSMPGVELVEWELAGQKRKVRRTRHEAGLIEAIRCMGLGRKAAASFRRELGIPKSRFSLLMDRIKAGKPEDPLVRAIGDTGVQLEVGGKGKQDHLVKPF